MQEVLGMEIQGSDWWLIGPSLLFVLSCCAYFVYVWYSDKGKQDVLNNELPLWKSLPLLVLNFVAMALCFTMWTWICHDGRLPNWPDVLDRVKHGPLIVLGDPEKDVVLRSCFNFALFLVFGFHHSFFARKFVRKFLQDTIVHPQAMRTVFVVVTATVWQMVNFMWQHHPNRYVWDARPLFHKWFGWESAPVLFWQQILSFIFVLLSISTVIKHDAFEFLGMRQLLCPRDVRRDEDVSNNNLSINSSKGLRPQSSCVFASLTSSVSSSCSTSSESCAPSSQSSKLDVVENTLNSTPKLLTTGLYGMVRHPMYMYLEAAIGVVPVMTLDRFIFLNASLFFLWIALPLEEDKLVDIFGQEYEEYRKKVPAFFPLWRWSWPGSSRDIIASIFRTNTKDPAVPPTRLSAPTTLPNKPDGVGIKRRTSPASSR